MELLPYSFFIKIIYDKALEKRLTNDGENKIQFREIQNLN